MTNDEKNTKWFNIADPELRGKLAETCTAVLNLLGEKTDSAQEGFMVCLVCLVCLAYIKDRFGIEVASLADLPMPTDKLQ